MKYYFASGSGQALEMLLEEKVPSILISYAYFSKGIPDNLMKAVGNGTNLMLDSGGFTVGKKGNASVAFDKYLEFLGEYKNKVTEYIQLDNPMVRRVTLRNYKLMIEKGFKPLFVDHIWFKWIPELNEIYKNKKLCWAGIHPRMNPDISKSIQERYDGGVLKNPRSKLHLLGFGQRLRGMLPWFDVVDSFDAATWAIAPGKFGNWVKYYPPSADRPFPYLKQHHPPWAGAKLPKDVYETYEAHKLNGYKYQDRIRASIREFTKYFAGMEKFFNDNKSKGREFLIESAMRKDVEGPPPVWPLQVYIRRDELIKAEADPYTSPPPENFRYPFTVQHHWKGKNLHADLRIAYQTGKNLLGWTLNTQIPGAVKEPVATLEEAKRIAKEEMGDISNIDWNTGEWKRRDSGESVEKVGSITLLADRKELEPYRWLEAEGVTRPLGNAPAIGGTKKYPGVFHIVDKGVIEYGAQKDDFHEYFAHGDSLNCRITFRRMKGTVAKADRKSVEGLEAGALSEPNWLASKMEDQKPFALSNDSLGGWSPPDGYSSLPIAIQKQIPAEFAYWRKGGTEANGIRAKLIEAMKAGNVEIDFSAPYKREVEKEDERFIAEIKMSMPIAKVDGEKRLVTGVVMEPDEVDSQGDTTDPDAIERAGHNFLAKYNRETQLGLLHKMFGEIGVELVESWITPEVMTIGNQKVKKGSWLMTVRVKDDVLWRKIKNGEITGFSIGGLAAVTQSRTV